MEITYPILLIAIGLVVLAFGSRLVVLGAAVGALLGVGVLRLFNISTDDVWLPIAIVGGLAVAGALLTGLVRGIVNVVLWVLGALAGAAIAMGFLDLFNMATDWLYWLLVVVGAAIGLLLVNRFKEIALIILAGFVGGLLVTRGLAHWFPTLKDDSTIGTLVVLLLAGAGIALQGGFIARSRAAAQAKAAAAAQAPAQAPAAATAAAATQPQPAPQPTPVTQPPIAPEAAPAPPPSPAAQPAAAPPVQAAVEPPAALATEPAVQEAPISEPQPAPPAPPADSAPEPPTAAEPPAALAAEPVAQVESVAQAEPTSEPQPATTADTAPRPAPQAGPQTGSDDQSTPGSTS
jgi:hypothetical protein